jgi:hypothetical protein
MHYLVLILSICNIHKNHKEVLNELSFNVFKIKLFTLSI